MYWWAHFMVVEKKKEVRLTLDNNFSHCHSSHLEECSSLCANAVDILWIAINIINSLMFHYHTDKSYLYKYSSFCHINRVFSLAESVHQTHCREDNWENTEPQVDHTRQSCTRLGPVHNSAVQRLRGPEDVNHGLSRPESTLLNDCFQLEWRGGGKKNNW